MNLEPDSSTSADMSPNSNFAGQAALIESQQAIGEETGMSSPVSDSRNGTAKATPAQPKRPSEGASLRWNFSWTFVGNIIYSACQWAILVVLAKVGNPEMVGQYGLAMAIATPILALSSLQLRAVLTTDVKEKVPFGEYLGFRLSTTALSLLIISVIPFVMRYRWDSTLVVLIIGLGQAIETLADLYWGRMQFYDHMDRIAKSMIARGILGLGGLAATVYLTKNVVWGATALVLGRGVVLIGYDMSKRAQLLPRNADRAETERILADKKNALRPLWNWATQSELFRTSIVLGVIAMLVSLMPNMPRYFIQNSLGERALGIFTATAFLVSSGSLIVNAMGQSAFVRLAKHYGTGDVAGFNSLLFKLLGIAAALGLAGIGIAVFFGHMLLTMLYRPEYAEHSDVLIAMMVGGAMTYVSGIMASAVTSARCFARQIPVLALAVGSAALSSYILVPKYGLLGGAFAVIITATVLTAGEVVLLWYILSNVNRLAEAEG
jgi:O-antigen/teichoic acid export membrane protein